MQPQYGHSPPTNSRSTTASVRPLPWSPPAIASPATPPPRQTTSNSCGNLNHLRPHQRGPNELQTACRALTYLKLAGFAAPRGRSLSWKNQWVWRGPTAGGRLEEVNSQGLLVPAVGLALAPTAGPLGRNGGR